MSIDIIMEVSVCTMIEIRSSRYKTIGFVTSGNKKMGREKPDKLKSENTDSLINVSLRSVSGFRSETMYDVIIIGAGSAGSPLPKR